MELNWFDIGVFLAFIGVVVGYSMFKSRKERYQSPRLNHLNYLASRQFSRQLFEAEQ